MVEILVYGYPDGSDDHDGSGGNISGGGDMVMVVAVSYQEVQNRLKSQ